MEGVLDEIKLIVDNVSKALLATDGGMAPCRQRESGWCFISCLASGDIRSHSSSKRSIDNRLCTVDLDANWPLTRQTFTNNDHDAWADPLIAELAKPIGIAVRDAGDNRPSSRSQVRQGLAGIGGHGAIDARYGIPVGIMGWTAQMGIDPRRELF